MYGLGKGQGMRRGNSNVWARERPRYEKGKFQCMGQGKAKVWPVREIRVMQKLRVHVRLNQAMLKLFYGNLPYLHGNISIWTFTPFIFCQGAYLKKVIVLLKTSVVQSTMHSTHLIVDVRCSKANNNVHIRAKSVSTSIQCILDVIQSLLRFVQGRRVATILCDTPT